MFTDLFGNAPRVKVLSFMMERDQFDHTISEIGRGAEVARPTVYKIMDTLVDEGAVVETRVVGNSRHYQINPEHREVARLMAVLGPLDETIDDTDEPPARGRTGKRAQGRRS